MIESGPEAVVRAANILAAGGVVAIPTETVYGLACDARNEAAIRRVFAIKKRPESHPLIVHVEDDREITSWARDVPDIARVLATAFWPGPLTIVLPRRPTTSPLLTAGGGTIALRAPAHPVAREILAALRKRTGHGAGLAAPSANRFTRTSPTRAEHVVSDLGDAVELVIDGGPCEIGIESTVIDLSVEAPTVLRLGAVPIEEIERALDAVVVIGGSTPSPGTHPLHYAPEARVESLSPHALDVRASALAKERKRVVAIVRAGRPLPVHHMVVASSDEALAKILYAAFRDADDRKADVLLIDEPSDHGVGLALRDRISRATRS